MPPKHSRSPVGPTKAPHKQLVKGPRKAPKKNAPNFKRQRGETSSEDADYITETTTDSDDDSTTTSETTGRATAEASDGSSTDSDPRPAGRGRGTGRGRGRPVSEKTKKQRDLRAGATGAALPAIAAPEGPVPLTPEKKQEYAARRTHTHEQLSQLFSKDIVCLTQSTYADYKLMPQTYRALPTVLVCKTCYESKTKIGKAFMVTHDYYAVSKHVSNHKVAGNNVVKKQEKPPKPTPEGDDSGITTVMSEDAKRTPRAQRRRVETPSKSSIDRTEDSHIDGAMFDDYALPLGALVGHLSHNSCRTLFKYWGPYLSKFPVPIKDRFQWTTHTVRDAVDLYCSRANKWLCESVISRQRFFGVAFDGGLSKHLGYHVLIMVLICEAGQFVLPSYYEKEGETFDSANLAKAVAKTLNDAGVPIDKIRAFVTDGCLTNFVAKEALDTVANIIQASAALHDEKEANEDAEIEFEMSTDFLQAVQELVRIHFPVAVEIRCRSHLRKTNVDHCHAEIRWKETRAFEFAKLFSRFLGSAECRPRVKRLLAFLKNESTNDDASEAKSKLCAQLQLLLQVVGAGTCSLNRLKHMIERVREHAVTPQLMAVVDQHLPEEVDHSSASQVHSSCMVLLDELTQKTHTRRGGSGFALTNATRWHSSIYRAYAFLAENFPLIAKWLCLEKITKSLEEMLALVQTRNAIVEIQRELKHYCEIFAPVAQYIHKAANFAVSSWEVVEEETMVEEQLGRLLEQAEAEKDDPWKSTVLQALLAEWRAEGNLRGDTLAVFQCIAFLSPSHKFGIKPLTHQQFLSLTSFTARDVPIDEWEAYETKSSEPLLDGEARDPRLWWNRHQASFPSMHAVALFLFCLPPVVTSCDSLLSLEGAMFTATQSKLRVERAAAHLQWAAQGDYLNRYVV